MKIKGNLFVIAAPSGAGKTSLVKAIIDTIPNLTVSISHTTRPMRTGEEHGINYYFINKNEFQELINHHDFLEYAAIFDHFYGTSKSWVEKTLAQGIDVILEIDWQGHRQIKALFPDTISIFILPPSLEALKERLIKRNQDNQEVIKKRLADTKETVSHIAEFDYVVINDHFSHAQQDLKTIIEACRLLASRQIYQFSNLILELGQE